MKHVYPLLLLLLCSLFGYQSNANEVTVKGYVKFANGTYAPNISVKIVVTSPCQVEHTVTTNQNGFYSDKVACDGAITGVRVSVLCNGQIISVIREVSTTNVVEVNLTLCYSPTISCIARFTATQLESTDYHPFAVKFNSSGSETSGDDKIVQRIWNFGDGNVMNEGTVDPVHDYQKPGEYNVCLTIKTYRGCTNTSCITVQVKSRCYADFRFENTSAGVKFNSSMSKVADGDAIIGRVWNFGDGTVMNEGTVDPLHAYEKPGVYKVCLTIKTAKGCTNTKCMEVEVAAHCVAYFRFENTNAGVKFNSSMSKAADGDAIIGRVWDFGDGTVMHDGTIDPLHDYEKPGVYKVCLTIKTDKGCTDTKCMAVEVRARCHADFRFENTSAGVQFNSRISKAADRDSIIGRVWYFGDGTIMEGAIDPVHDYEKPGLYNVCLVIKTAKGCTDKKCMTVEVKARCHADFRFENKGLKVKFNSSISKVSDGDSIIGRVWYFGDGTVLKGHIDPVHKYRHAGTYTVCLVIWTKKGCESKICKQVTVPERTPECRARFTFERVAPKKFRFSSKPSVVAPGDEIVERQWNFHDGTDIVTTHDVSILHEFEKPGVYEVCLKIKTAKGCESRFCAVVRVGDRQNEECSVQIISLYPQPVHAQLKVQIYSRMDHIPAKISIVDVYGQVKWTKEVWLEQGINPFEVPTEFLLAGPYFFRVITSFGVQSKLFYKI